MPRPDALQRVLDAGRAALADHISDPRSVVSVDRCFAALARTGRLSTQTGARLPICDQYLDRVSDPAQFETPSLRGFATAFRALMPDLHWVTRGGANAGASDNFLDSHANAMIVGPGGYERRSDVWFGVSLMAPHVRYPDHVHPPEETYLFMSRGEFKQASDPWIALGQGGSLYNPPESLHGMRSGADPFLAFWILWDPRGEA